MDTVQRRWTLRNIAFNLNVSKQTKDGNVLLYHIFQCWWHLKFFTRSCGEDTFASILSLSQRLNAARLSLVYRNFQVEYSNERQSFVLTFQTFIAKTCHGISKESNRRLFLRILNIRRNLPLLERDTSVDSTPVIKLSSHRSIAVYLSYPYNLHMLPTLFHSYHTRNLS